MFSTIARFHLQTVVIFFLQSHFFCLSKQPSTHFCMRSGFGFFIIQYAHPFTAIAWNYVKLFQIQLHLLVTLNVEAKKKLFTRFDNIQITFFLFMYLVNMYICSSNVILPGFYNPSDFSRYEEKLPRKHENALKIKTLIDG